MLQVVCDDLPDHYLRMNNETGSDWIVDLNALDHAEPWRIWWLTISIRSSLYWCFCPRNPILSLFFSGSSANEVKSLVPRDIDPNESPPPVFDPFALIWRPSGYVYLSTLLIASLCRLQADPRLWLPTSIQPPARPMSVSSLRPFHFVTMHSCSLTHDFSSRSTC